MDKPWTKDEFDAALKAIKASGEYQYPLDMQTGSTGEWWPYAFSPLLQSFGGDLINRSDFKSADGVLNGPEAMAWATWFQSLVTDGYMPAKSSADPQADFLNGKSALLWNGSWGSDVSHGPNSATTCCSCHRRTSVMGRRSVAAPGSGRSAPAARTWTAHWTT